MQPLGNTDVVKVLKFADDHSLEVAVKGGGHSALGHGLVDGGLVIDMSLMRGEASTSGFVWILQGFMLSSLLFWTSKLRFGQLIANFYKSGDGVLLQAEPHIPVVRVRLRIYNKSPRSSESVLEQEVNVQNKGNRKSKCLHCTHDLLTNRL